MRLDMAVTVGINSAMTMVSCRIVIKSCLRAWIHMNAKKGSADAVGVDLFEHKQLGGGWVFESGAFSEHNVICGGLTVVSGACPTEISIHGIAAHSGIFQSSRGAKCAVRGAFVYFRCFEIRSE